ncbi:MAG: 5-(carboxyamino)imidazole ribonucleotide mutase [Synergistaceae bacterium]|nr:5-(carboxyamino)imidazole ribonucleotide mutase [Synergistaceae bacterium]
MTQKTAVILGSDSDLPVAEKAVEVFRKLGLDFTVHVISAHRTPEQARAFAQNAASNGYGAIIAIAGKAAHLAGVLASHTRLPVIGVPVKSPDLGGMDALLSTVQMPSGVPVACVAIDGGANAAWLAARIFALNDEGLARRLEAEAQSMAESVERKNHDIAEKYNQQ